MDSWAGVGVGVPVPGALCRGAGTRSYSISLLTAVAWVICPQAQRPPASLLPVTVPQRGSLIALRLPIMCSAPC